jgi:hypothetical protein
MQKLIFDNDRLNRMAILLKCSFDYCNRKNMDWDEVLKTYEQLIVLLGDKK